MELYDVFGFRTAQHPTGKKLITYHLLVGASHDVVIEDSHSLTKLD